MAARRKPSLLRSIPGNRYFSQPKCCKHCGMRNCESEPSLPPIPTAALPSPPKPSAAAAGDVCVHSALVCRSGFPDFPHIFPKNKKENKWDDVVMGAGAAGSKHGQGHPCATSTGLWNPSRDEGSTTHCFSSSLPFLGPNIPGQSQEQPWQTREIYGINKKMDRNWKNSCNFPTWGSNSC